MRNKKTDFDSYVEQRLEQWAEWYMSGNHCGLGYPPRNILQRLREEGGILINGTGMKSFPVNSDAEEIEGLVVRLGILYKPYAEALHIRYFNKLTQISQAKCRGYTERKYQLYLRYAHMWMKGYLSASYL